MNRIVAPILVLLLVVSSAPPALAQSAFGYELKVKGMVCAFCAYSVSRQLRSVEGVAPDSILVDLESGTITVRSEKPLERARLARLVEAAGFALEAVTEAAPDSPRPAPRAERAARISLTLDANGLAEGEFDALLKTLGALASQRSAGVHLADLSPRADQSLTGKRKRIDVLREGESPSAGSTKTATVICRQPRPPIPSRATGGRP